MPSANRFWEIDFFRGLAVLAMILFHSIFDLSFFNIYQVNTASGFWWWFARLTAAAFVFIAGIAITISYSRAKEKNLAESELQMKYLKRGAWIFCLGLIITLFTWLFIKSGTIWFGILHFIGAATIIGYLLMRYSNTKANAALAIIILLAGIYLLTLEFDFSWLLWLGFQPVGFVSLDYIPLLPWLGVFILGMIAGSCLYPQAKRNFEIQDLSRISLVRLFCLAGSNSLLIYFLHQPVIIAVIYLVFPGVTVL